MNFNFFDWIREGVKRSVLLGVSDAVQQMGMPQDEQSSKETILAFLQEETKPTTGNRKRLVTSGSTPSRKLGRSINDIHTGKNAEV